MPRENQLEGYVRVVQNGLLAPLALERLFARDRRGAVTVLGAGIGTVALINPFALISFDGWFATYKFHALRGANIDNIWSVRPLGPIDIPSFGHDTLNLVTALLIGAFGVTALAVGWMHARKGGSYPVVQVSAALLAAFMLFNKVHSPQYALWIMPFFVLLQVPIGWWVAYAIADLAVYSGVFWYLNDICPNNVCVQSPALNDSERLMVAGVYGRATLLLILFVVFLRAHPTRAVSQQLTSNPPVALARSPG